MRLPFATLVLALSLPVSGWAGDRAWETVKTGPIVVRTRDRPDSAVKEIWAEGEMTSGVRELQLVLTDVKGFTHYMPYLTEAKALDGRDPDGATYVYSRLDLPVLSPRDFIHKVYIDRDSATDPEHVFANHWFAVPTKVAPRDGVVRLTVSEGSWRVTPNPKGGSHVVYRFSVDPGGSVPSFAANISGTNGIDDVFKAVDKEARTRASLQKANASDGGDQGH